MPSEKAKTACNTIISLAEKAQKGQPGYESILSQIEENLDIIEDSFHMKKDVRKKKKVRSLSKSKKKRFMKDTNIEDWLLKAYMKRKEKKEGKMKERVEYTLYETTEYGKLANRLFEKLTVRLTRDHPEYFTSLMQSLRASGIKILSKTYISMIFFSSLLAFITVALLASLLYSHPMLPFRIIRGTFIGILAAAITGVIFYFYPGSVAKTRDAKIKADLPFAIINMAGVAGSGGKPISIFKTLLSTDEYPGLRDEIKKIVNYVNLFGYDLSTALKAVARRTPSLRFKDLLDGIINTIESGGDLKDYLQTMANESLNTYRLERKKAVESISTYSDIYTTVLIAAPLLFFVTLAIIQTMGGEIGGMSVNTLATVGTYLVIPLLNVGFIIFLSVVQPK